MRLKKKEGGGGGGSYNYLKTHFKEGGINEGLITRMVQLPGKHSSFGQTFK